jgi:tetratricopeptide (TPR) repeat protein
VQQSVVVFFAEEPDQMKFTALLRRQPSRFAWCALSMIVLLTVGILFADWWICLPDATTSTYVGRQSCIQCHTVQARQWLGSHHDLAMDVASHQSVLGDFEDAELTHHGVASRFFRHGDKYLVNTEGREGRMSDFEIKYTFGVEPLQQYLVELDRSSGFFPEDVGRLQVLPLCWDTERRRWFYLDPPDVNEKISSDDPLHWTGEAQNWNYMCSECHSTNVQKWFDFDTNTYHATFSEVDVSCEACHGPGSVHVELATSSSVFWDRKRGYGLARLKGASSKNEIEMCATCHSRRRMIQAGYVPGSPYHDFFVNESLLPHLYHADGQILDEVYVHGSFVQSKMYHKGVRCTDCHNPHTAELKHEGNRVCTSCHQHPAGKYDSPAHHHHQPGTAGAACVGCHMPEKTYMEVDPRRDHGLKVPRPDLSLQLGTPNACSGCHLERTRVNPEKREALGEYSNWLDVVSSGDSEIRSELEELDRWAAEKVFTWYGEPSRERQDHNFAAILSAARRGVPAVEPLLRKLCKDRRAPAIVRATAVGELVQFEGGHASRTLRDALQDRDPQVRLAAVDAYQVNLGNTSLLERISRDLAPLLDDPRRAVRQATAQALAGVPPGGLTSQQVELRDRLLGQWRGNLGRTEAPAIAQMNLGVHYEQTATSSKELERAIESYEKSIELVPDVVGPRSNLVSVLETRLSLGPTLDEQLQNSLLDQIKELRQQELQLLKRDLTLLPDSAPPVVRAAMTHRYGLSLYLSGNLVAARKALEVAVRLQPNHPHYLFLLAKFYESQQESDRARQAVKRLLKLRPENEMYHVFFRELQADSD